MTQAEGQANGDIAAEVDIYVEELRTAEREAPERATEEEATPSKTSSPGAVMKWDVFISHASEDKESFVAPLAKALQDAGLEVWYDQWTLQIGDSQRRKIDEGLAKSQFGVVVLSPSFFAKEWPQRELDGLSARETSGEGAVLPIWHGVGREEVLRFFPTLADKVAVISKNAPDAVVASILAVVAPTKAEAKQTSSYGATLYLDLGAASTNDLDSVLDEHGLATRLWGTPPGDIAVEIRKFTTDQKRLDAVLSDVSAALTAKGTVIRRIQGQRDLLDL